MGNLYASKDKIAAAYIRVSTSRQGEEGYSEENQRKSIIEYANKKGLILDDSFIFEEEKPASKYDGYSADMSNIFENFLNRSKLTEILRLAQSNKFKHLLVFSRDRLSRDSQDSIALEMFFKKLRIEVHYIREGEMFEGLDKSVKNLLDIVFSSISEMEINVLSGRVYDGLKTCALKGKWTGGKAPFGYVTLKNKDVSRERKKWVTSLEISKFESTMVDRIFNLYSSGLGYRSVAKIMNQEYGFITWTKGKIEGIIKNQTYTGSIIWDRRGGRRKPNKRNAEPIQSETNSENVIISKDMWDSIVIERKHREEIKDKSFYSTKYILKDKILCPLCNKPMKAKDPGLRKTKIYYCDNIIEGKACKSRIPCSIAEMAFIEELKVNVFRDGDMEGVIETLNNKIDSRILERENIIKELDEKIKEGEDFVRKIKFKLSETKDEGLINALNLHYSIYSNYVGKYKSSKESFEQLIKLDKESKTNIEYILPAFISVLFEDINLKEVSRVWREFIVKFINAIGIKYDKIKKVAHIVSIDFLPS